MWYDVGSVDPKYTKQKSIFSNMRLTDTCMCRFHCNLYAIPMLGLSKYGENFICSRQPSYISFLTIVHCTEYPTFSTQYNTAIAVDLNRVPLALVCSNFHYKHCCRFQIRAKKTWKHSFSLLSGIQMEMSIFCKKK